MAIAAVEWLEQPAIAATPSGQQLMLCGELSHCWRPIAAACVDMVPDGACGYGAAMRACVRATMRLYRANSPHPSCAAIAVSTYRAPTIYANLLIWTPLPSNHHICIYPNLLVHAYPSSSTGLTLGTPIPDLTSIPQKIIQRILKAEYVDMRELLPDAWDMEDQSGGCCHNKPPKRRGLITNISRWTECYASMVSVIHLGTRRKHHSL